MANPKYADLPGIAIDQPDVYETIDLPEAEQGNVSMSDILVDQCDSVEPLNVSADEAYNRFKGKTISSRNVDFTDCIGPTRKTGYDIRSGEWELIGDKTKEEETPLQAYNRLQYEVKKLFEDVNQMKNSSDEKNSSELSPVILAQKVDEVHKEIQSLHMENILGSEAIAEMSDPLGSLHKKLLSDLETFKSTPVTEKKASSQVMLENNDVIKYELFVRAEQAKLEETAKIANLEQRLRDLESVVGQDKKKLSFLTSNTDGKSINASINLLSSKLNLLDSNYLDQIESRLALLHQCMQQVSEKKHQIDDAEKQNKISELYELAKKVDELSVGLPQVVERLVALKDLHDQALQFSKTVTQLDTTQQQISNALKCNEKLLKDVQGTFATNSEMIESNITSLNSRITQIK